MRAVHIANTNFEFELNHPSSLSIEESLSKNSLCLQLQFLPFLFANENDAVAITRMAAPNYFKQLKNMLNVKQLPHPILLKEEPSINCTSCSSWGPSQQVARWAHHHHLLYTIPNDWEMIKKINGKDFSSTYSSLKKTTLITNILDLNIWLAQPFYPKVLKTCFGLSGTGHLIIHEETNKEKINRINNSEWAMKMTVVAEPWNKRVFDFSTQWNLNANGTFEMLGATVFQTRKNGGYLGTFAGPADKIFGDYLPFLHSHIQVVQQVLKDLAKEGYFGAIGFDALLYHCEEDNQIKLYPLVEINGRKTLSLVALRLQQTYYPNQTLHLSFQKPANHAKGLLPFSLGPITFKQNLIMELL